MSMFLEVMLYIVIAFGIMIITMTILEKELVMDSYVLEKDELKIEVKVNICGATEEEREIIKKIIEKGEYTSIYDLTDNFIIE